MIADPVLSTASAAARLKKLDEADASRRLWARDPKLWKPEGPPPAELTDRLGWLETPRAMEKRVPEFAAFGRELMLEGAKDVVLLGMGGSSLFADLLACTFGPAEGAPRLSVCDSTFPDAVLAARERLDLPSTFFLVASKSGSTTETACLYEYFRGEVEGALGKSKAGSRFAAITDPGTPFERQARDQDFRHVFLSPPDVGGRYSALTPFGLVPAAALGLDVARLLAKASKMAADCGPDRPASMNPGFQLGAWLGEAAREGKDKLTLLISPPLASFGAWLEQLIAESTGKEGKGILPIEWPEPEEAYGEDRVFVYVRLEGQADPAQERRVEALLKGGRPVLVYNLKDRYDLGAEVFRWEVATAVSGVALGINPFDQPNVQETKTLTKALLEAKAAKPAPPAKAEDALAMAGRARPGDFIALNAFIEGSPGALEALSALRRKLGERFRRPVTAGIGPRYLHSTGQLHKGGPASGIFFVLTATPRADAAIPGRPYTFGRLVSAQAEGDLQALLQRGRRAVRLELGPDPVAGLRRLAEAA
ncbi:MAG: glucose-6-phosphate isomerase [Elusimicrobia bacterium]|nr:glucose-6-phosphate isomerase [Elusimicrobiota bacterium]